MCLKLTKLMSIAAYRSTIVLFALKDDYSDFFDLFLKFCTNYPLF